MSWRRNTDDLGRIYLNLTRNAANRVEIALFKDSARSDGAKVASGVAATMSTQGTIALISQPGVGLTGLIGYRFRQENRDIYIAAFPEWTARRLQHLRQQWKSRRTR